MPQALNSTDPPLRRDTLISGAHQLHRISVVPGQPPFARLAFLHGYGDHAGRYVHFLQWMAQRGVACHAIDFRGHGQSTGKPAHINRWDEYLDDLTAFLNLEELSNNEVNASPLFVVAHSHGGLAAAAAAIRGRLSAAGVILSSPYLDLKMPVPLHKKIFAAVASRVAPNLGVKSGIGGEMLSRDSEMIADTKTDPLNRGIVTPRWFTTARRTQGEVRARASEFTLPLLMLVAGEDRIADPAASIDFYEHCGSKDKTLKTYEGFRHELLRELGRERVFEDILAWLRQRSPGSDR